MIDLLKIERLMQLMSQYGIDTVEASSGPEKMMLSKTGMPQTRAPQGQHINAPLQAATQAMNAGFAATASLPASLEPAAPTAAVVPDGLTIRSPFVGTFYRQPTPESPVFAEVGMRVKKGQTLCIIEAMKLMNEIEAEIDGVVVAVLAENAKPVEFDTPLFVIAP